MRAPAWNPNREGLGVVSRKAAKPSDGGVVAVVIVDGDNSESWVSEVVVAVVSLWQRLRPSFTQWASELVAASPESLCINGETAMQRVLHGPRKERASAIRDKR